MNEKKKFTIEKGRKVLEKSARRRGSSNAGDSLEEGDKGKDGGEGGGKQEARLENLQLGSPKQSGGTQEAQPSILPLRTPKQSKAPKSGAKRSQNKKNKAKAS